MSDFPRLEIELHTVTGLGKVVLDGVDLSAAVDGITLVRGKDGNCVAQINVCVELEARIEGDVTIVRSSRAGLTVLPVDGTTHKIKRADAS